MTRYQQEDASSPQGGETRSQESLTALQASFEYAEALLETVREPLLVLDSTFHVVSANPSFYHTFQATKKTTEKILLYDIGNQQWDIPALRTLLEEILPNQHIVNDYEVEHDFPIIGKKNMLCNVRALDQNTLILLAIEDVTAAKHIQKKSEVARKRLYDLFMHAPAFVAVLSGPDLRFELANPPYRLLVGKERALDGKPLLEAVPDIDQALFAIINQVAFKGERFVANELPITLDWDSNAHPYTKFLTLVYEPLYDEEAKPNGLMCFGYEVTTQVEARQAAEHAVIQLEQQAKTFAITLSAVKDFIYTFNPSGQFTYASKSLLDLLQISLEEIVGKTFHELPYPKDVADTLQAYIAHVVANGQPIVDETPFTSPAGHLGFYEYIFVPVFDNQGNVVTVAGSTRDITQRKLQERQKDNFIGVASHELKTPVTSLKGYTQLLERRFRQAGDERTIALLQKMDAQINKLTLLITDLLDVTKIESGHLLLKQTTFEWNALIVEIAEEVQYTTIRHRIGLDLSSPVLLSADRGRVGQVLTNLLANAIKYSPQAATIIVKTDLTETAVVTSVQDFGIGIPKEKQAHLFERFFRVDGDTQQTYPGLGLGLYISAEFIKRHHGSIWIESNEGQGTTVTFSLPFQSDTEGRRDVEGETT